MEDFKCQDTNLTKEVSKIKAKQAKLAKKLGEQEKGKTAGPKQETAMLIVIMFLVLVALILAGSRSGFEQKLQKSDQVMANLTEQIKTLLMERSKLEANLDSLNTTIADEPQQFDSKPENSWETLKAILMAILASVLAVLAAKLIVAIVVQSHASKPKGDDRLYLQIHSEHQVEIAL